MNSHFFILYFCVMFLIHNIIERASSIVCYTIGLKLYDQNWLKRLFCLLYRLLIFYLWWKRLLFPWGKLHFYRGYNFYQSSCLRCSYGANTHTHTWNTPKDYLVVDCRARILRIQKSGERKIETVSGCEAIAFAPADDWQEKTMTLAPSHRWTTDTTAKTILWHVHIIIRYTQVAQTWTLLFIAMHVNVPAQGRI